MWIEREIGTLYKYILTEEHPNLPTANATRADLEIYEKQVKDDEMAHCYTLALMSSILPHQLKDYLSTRNMILSLKEMFENKDEPLGRLS